MGPDRQNDGTTVAASCGHSELRAKTRPIILANPASFQVRQNKGLTLVSVGCRYSCQGVAPVHCQLPTSPPGACFAVTRVSMVIYYYQ